MSEVYKSYIGGIEFLIVQEGEMKTTAIPSGKILCIITNDEEDYPLHIETGDSHFRFDEEAAKAYHAYIGLTKS